MIEIDEETVDKAIDDILGTDEPVSGEKTETAGDGQDKERWDIPGEGTEMTTCRRCGTTFLRPRKSKRTICPACFSAQVSAGMKASHAARRAKRDARKAAAAEPVGAVQEETGGRPMVAPTTGAASVGPSRLPPTGAAARPEENETHLYPSDELLAKWEALREAEDTSSAPLEPEPPEPEPGTGAGSLDREDGAWGLLTALYGATRDVARTIGADTKDVIEALFRMNSAMDYMWRKRGERA